MGETINTLDSISSQDPISLPNPQKKGRNIKKILLFCGISVFGICCVFFLLISLLLFRNPVRDTVVHHVVTTQLPTSYTVPTPESRRVYSQSIFNVVRFQIPMNWYISGERENEITYGSGILSYFTVRNKIGSDVLKNRYKQYREDGSSVSSQIVTVNGEKYERNYIGGRCMEDVCSSGLMEWIIPIENDHYVIFSHKEQDIDQMVKVIASIELYDGLGKDCRLTYHLSYGCGLCSNVTPIKKCLYRSKEDSICKIAAEDEKLRKNPQACANVGCSRGIAYEYCD